MDPRRTLWPVTRCSTPFMIGLPFTTTLITPGSRVTVDEYRNLVMEVG